MSASKENSSAPNAQQAADGERFCDQATGRRWMLPLSSRITWYIVAFGLVSGLVYLMPTASTGPPVRSPRERSRREEAICTTALGSTCSGGTVMAVLPTA